LNSPSTTHIIYFFHICRLVGYSIKLEKKSSKKTRLLLCTTGILLRRLQGDPDLASVSHVFVDETHERDLNTDFLLIILKDLLLRRKSLKLILMSATLKAEAFAEYFGGCAVVSIPGRTHPVEEFRLVDILQLTEYEVKEDSDYAIKKNRSSIPGRLSKSALRKLYYPKYRSSVIQSLSIVDETVINYELLADLLEHICLNKDEGAILVFLPGMMEIQNAMDNMRRKDFFQSSAVIIYPLHSALSTAEQTAVFDVPPSGVRKIVVSTNISETSITIEGGFLLVCCDSCRPVSPALTLLTLLIVLTDVVYVVDCGRVKELRQDLVKETPELVECWVSRASATQRRGRAGRVRPGMAYHFYSTYDSRFDDHGFLYEYVPIQLTHFSLS
jgi:ATP-dependent RNA helicase DHX36